jgi:hypothetical protein
VEAVVSLRNYRVRRVFSLGRAWCVVSRVTAWAGKAPPGYEVSCSVTLGRCQREAVRVEIRTQVRREANSFSLAGQTLGERSAWSAELAASEVGEKLAWCGLWLLSLVWPGCVLLALLVAPLSQPANVTS